MEKSLVIMAAGMGSRFGGLKQIQAVGPSNEIIADYSIYDAIQAGFDKVIFIIKEEHLEYFENNITNKFKDKIKVEYAFQRIDNLIGNAKVPEGRTRMWGTGHAIYSAIDHINGPFMLINADDFYGREAFMKISKFFDKNQNENEYFMITYPFITTINEATVIKRGLCIPDGNIAKSIVECEVTKEQDEFTARMLVTGQTFKIAKDHPTSMNCFGFKKSFMDLVKEDFIDFCSKPLDLDVEFLLPEPIRKGILNEKITMYFENTTDQYLGITYPEDLPVIQNELQKLIDKGIYPNNLWGK